MSNIVDLSLIAPIPTSLPFKQQMISVFNTGRHDMGVTSGGACCCFVTPSGISWLTVELWGAGGDGGGACCCAGPYKGAGNGKYTKRTFQTGTSPYFIICAGGSGCCAQSNCGTCGFPSWVRDSTATTVACAGGGSGGCTYCGHMGGQSCTGNCIPSCNQDCSSGLGDLCMPTITGADHQNNYCTSHTWQWLPGANRFNANTRHSIDTCTIGMTASGNCYYLGSHGVFPGGAGTQAHACAGGCCWGAWGIGGLAIVTYG